jgi:hypothetical protein
MLVCSAWDVIFDGGFIHRPNAHAEKVHWEQLRPHDSVNTGASDELLRADTSSRYIRRLARPVAATIGPVVGKRSLCQTHEEL